MDTILMDTTKETIYFESFNFGFIKIILLLLALLFLGLTIFQFAQGRMPRPAELMSIFLVMSVLFAIFINFKTLSLTIKKDSLEARYGILAKRIKLKDITSAKDHQYKFTDYWGWGIRPGGNNTTAYNMPGDNYHGLLIEYKTPKTSKKLFVSSRDPQKVIEVIQNNLKI